MTSLVTRFFSSPQPFRALIRKGISKAKIGSPKFRSDIGAIERPSYAYLVFQAAQLAHRLGHDRVSVIEFGVAGGRGLLALESHADWVEKLLPVKIEIYGFDTGEGLPQTQDYRDLPYHWKPGFYRMDQTALTSKLKRGKLVLGDVATTVKTFAEEFDPAPIGAVSYDLDYYTSTIAALALFDIPDRYQLPRIVTYFDDTLGGDIELYGDHTGERLAIHEFNNNHAGRKLSPAYYLQTPLAYQIWRYRIWTMHNFHHFEYSKFVSADDQQLMLKS